MTHYGNNRIRKTNRRKQVSAKIGVLFHSFEFGGGERAWLVKNIFRYRQFAHVVQQCGGSNRLLLTIIGDAEASR